MCDLIAANKMELTFNQQYTTTPNKL